MMQSFEWLKTRWCDAIAWLNNWARSLRRTGPFYFGSMAVHLVLVWGLIEWHLQEVPEPTGIAMPQVDTRVDPEEMAQFELVTPPLRLSQLTAKSLADVKSPAQIAKHFDESALFEDAGGGVKPASNEPSLGGLGGFKLVSTYDGDAATVGNGGVGTGGGLSGLAGSGGILDGFNGAGRGERPKTDGSEAVEETERAVAAALNWLHRHQCKDGSWSATGYVHNCRDATCAGAGSSVSNLAATANSVLAFLSAGQTHLGEGPYRGTVSRAVEWLAAQQSLEREIAGASPTDRQARCMAAFALCEVYRMTGDEPLVGPLQRTLPCIEQQALSEMDGWHWAVVASAERAGLSIDPAVAMQAEEWRAHQLQRLIPAIADAGAIQNLFAVDAFDLPPVVAQLAMSLPNSIEESTSDELTRCFLAVRRPARGDSIDSEQEKEQDRFRRRMFSTQAKTGCATGSWPANADSDIWAPSGSRLVATSLAACLLAASYRHLPMYQLKSNPIARELDREIHRPTRR